MLLSEGQDLHCHPCFIACEWCAVSYEPRGANDHMGADTRGSGREWLLIDRRSRLRAFGEFTGGQLSICAIGRLSTGN